jgi:hypothetical protein
MNRNSSPTPSRTDRSFALGLGLLAMASLSTPVSAASSSSTSAPARVSQVGALGASGVAATIGELDEVRLQPVQYNFSFDQPMWNPPGDDAPGDVTAPTSYRLIADYPTPGLQTTSCDAISADDTQVPFVSVTYDGVARRAALKFALPALLVGYEGQFRLLICDGLVWDDAGVALDGDGDGQSGGEFKLSFRSETKSLIRNSHFDRDTAQWTPLTGEGAEWFHDPMDAESVATSGSGAFENIDSEEGLGAFQCVSVNAGGDKMRLRAKLVAPNASDGWEWEGHLICAFYTQPDCAGESFDGFDVGFIVVAPFDGWQSRQREFYPPTEAVSAQCGLLAYPEFGTEYCLDSVELVVLPVFADDFENGTSTRWSVVEPSIN